MPLMQCTKDGKSGWKFGESGHCYTGPNGKSNAARQGRAIEMSKHAKGELTQGFLSELHRLIHETEEGK